MTHTMVKTFTRPNTDTVWYEGSSEKQAFMIAQINAGNRISRDISISENELVKTVTTVWKDEQALNAIQDAPEIITHRQARKAYSDANGITGTAV